MIKALISLLTLLSLFVLFIGAKPNEIVNFNQLYPEELDSLEYSSPLILKYRKIYSFPGNKFLAVVDLKEKQNALLFFELKENKDLVEATILDLPIEWQKLAPKFYANYNCNTCLSWIVYWSPIDNKSILTISKLNKMLPQRGDNGYSASKFIQYSIIKSENAECLQKNYQANRIEVGESSPWGCYYFSHSDKDSKHIDKDSIVCSENVWLCEEMMNCKNTIKLYKN